MNKTKIEKWWNENKDDVLFGACLFGLSYSCTRLGYILGKRDGYFKALIDIFSAVDDIKKF